MRILIVDDELVSREKLRKIMADFGECIVVDNGADALKIATSQAPPDLILLDIIMPEMDGYEVCKRLKAERSTSDIPVIFITSKQDEDDEAKGLELGAVDYIRKPFSPSIVKARVQTHLELKKHRDRLEELINERTVKLKKTTKEMQVEIAERKQTEAVLKENEEKFRAIFENIQDVYYQTDMQGTIVLISPSAAEVYGVDSTEELIGCDIAETFYYHPEDRNKSMEEIAKTGYLKDYTVIMRRKDGTPVPAEINAHFIYEKEGNVIGIEGIVRDISGRKQAEESLRESEERYSSIVENSLNAIILYQQEKILFANEPFFNIFGYGREELQDMVVNDLLAPEVVNDVEELRRRRLAGEIEKASVYESKGRRKDGEIFDMEISACVILYQGEKCIMAFLSDISIRKQAEAALRKAHDELEWRVKERTGELVKINEQLKVEIEERKQVEEVLQTREKLINTLLNNQIDAATVVDKELKMLYVNEFLADRFQMSVDEMIGLTPEDIGDKADIVTAKRMAYFKQVATTGKPVRFEDNRAGMWFDNVVTPVLDKDGQVFQIAILARNITEKKKVEQALIESEEKYRGLVETMAEGLAIQDENGLIIYVNNSFCKMTGYQQHEVIGKKIIDFLDERNRQMVKGEIAKRRKGAPARSYETEIIRKDGHQISVFLSPRDIFYSDGQFKGSFAVFTDISSRKQAEERLRASEQRLTQAIDFLPDATMVIDLEGKVIAWNRAIENMTGINAQDMLGKGDYEYAIPFYGERRPVLIDIVGKWDKEVKKKYQYIEMEGGSLVSETYDPLVKPGGFLWNKASLLYNHNGEIIGAIESIRDITDKKVAEAALRESEVKYRELAENAGLGIYQVTRGGKFLMANQRMANIFGYDSQQDFLGDIDNAIKLYVNPEERPGILKSIDEKGHIDGRELNFKRKDGTPIFCNAYIRSVQAKDGEYIYEGLLEDITARKRTAKELRLLSSSLLKVQERERKRISLELHDELGQSLLAMKLQISFIEKRLGENQTELRSGCQAMLDHIVELVGHIRRICKDLSPVILDDLGLTAGIRWLAENALKGHGIDASLDISDIDRLLTDEQQLLVFRIFQEAFTNIVRHSSASLTSIIIEKQAEAISFVIEDNGRGFEVKKAKRRDFTDRGMGLSAMKERVWMLGGNFNIWSQLESGSRIEFRVPIEQPEKTVFVQAANGSLSPRP